MVVSLKSRILAIDVGVCTQDTLLYDEIRLPENSVKMVFPSMTQVLAKRVYSAKGDLLFYGETMGGGPLSSAIARHIERGYRVFMTPRSAMTIRDDLGEVRGMGVEIVDEREVGSYKGEKIETKDVDFGLIKDVLSAIGEEFRFDCIGVAVQDHGHAPRKSDRVFRFEKIRDSLKKRPRMQELGYRKPPKYYARMNSALRTIRKAFTGKAFVVDTKIAAIVGALHGIRERPAVSIDIGNGHTLVAIVGEEDHVLGMLEHHTHLLTRKKLEGIIEKFVAGQLTNREVFEDGGHGCHIEEAVGMENVKKILVTGPKRELLKGSRLNAESANPLGDVMMTGPIGVVDMVKGSH
jgi:uncharacterized protein (DUF1786 family)